MSAIDIRNRLSPLANEEQTLSQKCHSDEDTERITHTTPKNKFWATSPESSEDEAAIVAPKQIYQKEQFLREMARKSLEKAKKYQRTKRNKDKNYLNYENEDEITVVDNVHDKSENITGQVASSSSSQDHQESRVKPVAGDFSDEPTNQNPANIIIWLSIQTQL